jgi:uncharacterized protein (DUF2252 family)
MVHRTVLGVLLLTVLASSVGARQETSNTYDLLRKAHAPFLEENNWLQWPMKVRAIAETEYKFWRGSKDLFLDWCKQHCADWLADEQNFQTTHGDIHFGNMGTYPVVGFGKVAVGLIDFDESARLPFQFDLLQGLIVNRLAARQNKLSLTSDQQRALDDAMLDEYIRAALGRKTATEALKSDALARSMLQRPQKTDYAKLLGDYTINGKFRSVVLDKKGRVKEVLTPARDKKDALVRAIVEGINNDASTRSAFRIRDRADVDRAFKDAVLRTRVGSSGSQGQQKIFVLLDKPLNGVDHDLIVYLKQEVPSAAQRAGLVLDDTRSPGQRAKRETDNMNEPNRWLSSWCEIESRSFWFTFHEDYSTDLDVSDAASHEKLLQYCKVWGAITGSSHAATRREESLERLFTQEVREALIARADAFVAFQASEYEKFKLDPRVRQYQELVNRKLDELARSGG